MTARKPTALGTLTLALVAVLTAVGTSSAQSPDPPCSVIVGLHSVSFTMNFSAADPDVAYVMGVDPDQTSDPSGGKHIYRSTDRGQSFEVVVDQGNGITLINGPEILADPSNADVLYFAFGSRFAGGVTLYRYDHAVGTTTWQFNTDHTGIRALAIDPDAPDLVYVGFEGP
jgi:hypothetical protein